MSTELRTRRRTKTFAPRVEPPAPVRSAKARAPARTPARPVIDASQLRPADEGQAISPELRRRLEAALDRPLGHVRIHTAPADRERVSTMRARAFAHRHHIWLGPHESPSDVGLLAHEVAHVVQQGFAPRHATPAHAAASPGVAPHAATRMRAGVPGPRSHRVAVAAPARPARGAVQRFDLDIDPFGAARRAAGAVASGVSSAGRAVVSGARRVGGAVVEAGEALVNMAWDKLMDLVDEIAPDFAKLFKKGGIVEFVRGLIEKGLRSMFEGLTGPLRGIINFGAIGDRISQAVGWLSAIAGQLARNDCSGILAAARRVGEFFSDALKPVVDRIRSIADKVTGFFRGIWDAIGAPLMDILKRIGGTIWEGLKSFVKDVGKVIRKVRDALGDAWTRVKTFFGIGAEEGEGEGGGLWEWIKEKAKSVGESISNLVKPVIGPLKTVGAVLLMISPGGQLLAVMIMWPRLKQAWAWLSQKWTDLNLIPRARRFLANTVLPALMSAAESVGHALVGAAEWLLALIEKVEGALMTALRAAKGILTPLGTLLINFAHQQFKRITSWARSGLRSASRNMRSLVEKLVRFLGLVLDAMQRLIAIAVNPFGITGFLLGTIWRLIPECLKGPIIDFILEVIERFLRALPPMPMLGPLFPLIKSAALGFIGKVKSFGLQRKVNVSNKMAKIVSGQSTAFAFGFLKGLALGVWEGIISPFQAIATIFDLPDMIQRFLGSLGIRLCELIESIRCFAANLAGKVFGTLDDVLRGLGELLEDPAKILDLIKCAIEGALAGARSIGATIAEKMMEIFEGPDEAIGEMLGNITGNALVQAVITYFTAGAGAAVGIIKQISSALSAVGKAIGAVVKMLSQLLGKLVGFVKGLASRFASAAASGARSVLGRLGGFFRRVAAWFGKLLRRIFRGVKKRLMLTPAERVVWVDFLRAVNSIQLSAPNGMTGAKLRQRYKGILSGHKKAAKWPAYITKHRQNWRLWVRKVKTLRPRNVATVLLDPRTRLYSALKEVKKKVVKLKKMPGILGIGQISRVMPPIQRRYHLRSLQARWDEGEGKFVVHGVANPPGDWTTRPERPAKNEITIQAPNQSVKVDPLSKLHTYVPPQDPPSWSDISQIKTVRTGTTAEYVRGHLAHGRFGSGASGNIAAITRKANKAMRDLAEGIVIGKLKRKERGKKERPVFKYYTSSEPASPGRLLGRKIGTGRKRKCMRITAERHLVKSITVRFVEYGFTGTDWTKERSTKTKKIKNVPPYPPGFGEPCDPTS